MQSPSPKPQGLTVQRDFISPSEQAGLIERIRPILAQSSHIHKNGNRSAVVRYGYAYQEKTTWIGQCPEWLYLDGKVSQLFGSITLNEYEPGCAIVSHLDSPLFHEDISCLSLGSEAVMRFTRDGELFDVEALPGTLLTMTGESRYQWQHEILPVTQLRYSIVYRKWKGL